MNSIPNFNFIIKGVLVFMIFSTLEHILIHISFSIVSILMTIHLITFFADEIVKLYDSSEKGMIISFFCITGLLITRWIYSGHFPLSDLYESLIFLSWSFSLTHIVTYFKKNQNILSIIIGPSTIFTQGFATSGLLTEIHQSTILVPALQSEWLIMHVSMMILGYAALLCGSLLSVSLLVIRVRKNRKFFSTSNHLLNLNESFFFGEIEYMNEQSNVLQNISFFSPRNYYRSQLIQQLDYWSYRIISLGFIFLTIGILSGAVWANEAWGSYWSWDPKETWAFITWIIFAIYLHTRTNKKRNATNSAIVASIGFLIIWICYFGVNLLGIGLHSYGSFTLTSN
nr:cytochrome c heme attachment protein [Erythranthe caespitosa]YP_010543467.1 cytochrome c heme attachment protein [Erythranthe glaucescens]YP_010543554.1 cytochrome c heme attachment protein [Erythranthe guttata]YP_010544163.1 cytochrome c heme attachment protein [Erythranthe tilingii]UYG20815.1 cytochrome c heme attachment protein [Erythranthe caespitosa]UYG21163.1 cytochrome c heme attachment protein [Erythranthe glaucescens]UYG21250.1 cytochrome c heme attachment protein [Erythranthe gut